jgi:hypothetical protein
MKRNKQNTQKTRTLKVKGESNYKRKREFCAKEGKWGFEYPIGEKPWK